MSEIRLSNMPTMTVGQLTQQLAVQHPAVGDDDNGLEDLLVVVIVQAGEPVGQPGDGIGLTGTGAVLNEIVLAGAVCLYIGQQLGHHIQMCIRDSLGRRTATENDSGRCFDCFVCPED